MEGWNTFDRATLYSIDTVFDGEGSLIVKFSSMAFPAWLRIIQHINEILVILLSESHFRNNEKKNFLNNKLAMV